MAYGHFEHTRIGDMIILTRIWKKWIIKTWKCFSQLRMGSNGVISRWQWWIFGFHSMQFIDYCAMQITSNVLSIDYWTNVTHMHFRREATWPEAGRADYNLHSLPVLTIILKLSTLPLSQAWRDRYISLKSRMSAVEATYREVKRYKYNAYQNVLIGSMRDEIWGPEDCGWMFLPAKAVWNTYF